jgi:hypothetical protein
MSVLQPLYYPGGRYTAGTDRKLLASLIASESDGTRVTGVIPSYEGTKSMKVTANSSNMTITIQPGLCVIPDLATQSADSPGLYLAGVDTSVETVDMETNSTGSLRTDSLYAVVDDTPYTIVTKVLTSNKATITTATAHGFKAGQTVVITGVDNVFDGTYVILGGADVPTTYAFTYARTHANVTSTNVRATVYGPAVVGTSTVTGLTITNKALTSNIATLTTGTTAHGFDAGTIVTIRGVDSVFDGTYQVIGTPGTYTFDYSKIADDVASTAITSSYSSIAIARVPFAIKVEKASGTTLTGKTKIKLAEVDVPGSSATAIPAANVRDFRYFVSVNGGIHYYDGTSSATAPAAKPGRLRYDTSANKLELYDGTDATWRVLYSTTNNSHADFDKDASTTAIHHTLGTGANQAAAGDHSHTSVAATGAYGTITNSAYIDATIPANTTTLDQAWSGKSAAGGTFTTSTSGRVLINMSALMYTYNTDKVSIISVRIGTGGTIDGGTQALAQSTSGKNSIRMEGGSTANIAVRTGISFVLGLTANTLYNACFYYYNSDTVPVPLNDAYIEFIPIP